MSGSATPRINGVVETALYVDDLARATAFYRDVLGLEGIAGDGVRFQVFDGRARCVLLLFKRGGTLEPAEVPGGVIPPHDGAGRHCPHPSPRKSARQAPSQARAAGSPALAWRRDPA